MAEIPKKSIRILFVEDDEAARAGYREYLESRGYDVSSAATGHDALTMTIGWVPDVVILDLGLPDIDGWEVARRLRTASETAAVPIIALTGAHLQHEKVSAMRAGCDRHLAKPCTPADLIHAIQDCVGES